MARASPVISITAIGLADVTGISIVECLDPAILTVVLVVICTFSALVDMSAIDLLCAASWQYDRTFGRVLIS